MKQERLGILFIAVCFCFALYAFGKLVFSFNGPSYGDEQMKGFATLPDYRASLSFRWKYFLARGFPAKRIDFG